MACSSSASRSRSRPAPSTAMPASASLTAQLKPIPLLAPVTIATCMSVDPLRQRRPDLVFEDFPGIVLGQSVPDDHPLRGFERGQAVRIEQIPQIVDTGC